MKKIIYGIVIVILVALLLASCSGGNGVVSDDASDTSVFESESPSEHPSPSGDTSGVIDLPWETPEDIENPSQGLELAESYSKEFGDCYVVTGIGTCTDEDLVIPSTVNGIPVTEIANNAFYRNNKIKSVYCGNRVTVIGFQAFENCSNLKKVIIPDSVEKICEEAFCWCGLTEVQIGDRVKEMGRAAFQQNDRLKSVKLPYCLTVIPEDAFNNCTSLSEIEFSPNTVKIEKMAFDRAGLKNVKLPASLQAIQPNSFTCPYLMSFEVDEENPYLCSADGVLFSKDMAELIMAPAGRKTDYSIPDGVKTIDTYAFMGFKYEVSLPESVRTISEVAFYIPYQGNITINIKKGLSFIDSYAFSTANGSVTINFEGTKEEWNSIRKSDDWYLPDNGVGNQTTTIKCSDGQLTFNFDWLQQ